MREKLLYRGNGDPKDKLDLFLAEYILRNKLYVEVTYVQHGLYIIGRGFAVKVQQAKTKLLVSSSHLGSNFIPIEKHIETVSPDDWARILTLREIAS